MPPKSLNSIVEPRKSQPHQLIEALHDIQENYGYLSEESMRAASEKLGVPLMEVFRVASFYKAFKLKPGGKNTLTICMGTACHVRGSQAVHDQAAAQLGIKTGEVTKDGLISIEHVNCVGACALGPIVSEKETYHERMTPSKIRKLIDSIRGVKKGAKEDE